MVAAKNSLHGSMNPRAQFQELLSVADVLAAPPIAEPLTLPMCSPIGDGAAAVIVVSERKARELGLEKPVRVACIALVSGWDTGPDESVGGVARHARPMRRRASARTTSPASSCTMPPHLPRSLATSIWPLCGPGEGIRLIETNATRLGGRIPVNTSGGLLRKGHPVGATGCAQIVELTEQLQGRSGNRQVAGARIALAHNGGGAIGTDAAATVRHDPDPRED